MRVKPIRNKQDHREALLPCLYTGHPKPMNSQISRRTILFLLGANVCRATSIASPLDDECQSESGRSAWVAESLKQMLIIKLGMSRDQLTQVFTTEGGLSTGQQRTFVSRDCPFFKVDVTFRRALDNQPNHNWLQELGSDVIASISRPSLQLSVMD